MMTMLVATLGLLPAAMSHAIGSDSQRPFAIVIVGGLMSDLLLSIFLLPTLYVWIAREGTSSRNRRWHLRARLISLLTRTMGGCALGIACLASHAGAQQPLTWDQVKAKFEAVNPVLKADAANVEEMKAEEITAFLRPNPQFTLLADGTQIAPHNGAWTPVKGTTEQPNFSYLHEREHKRNCGWRAPGKARRLPSHST